MGWFTALLPMLPGVIDLIGKIIGRRNKAAQTLTAQASAQAEAEWFSLPDTKKEIRKLAEKITGMVPEIELDCLMKVLPGFLRDLADVFTLGNMFGDPRKLIDIVITHIGHLIRCQAGITAQALSPEALNGKLLECGIGAAVTYFQTKDPAKAISQFLACVLGSVGGGGDNGATPPPSSGFVGMDTDRCGGAPAPQDTNAKLT